MYLAFIIDLSSTASSSCPTCFSSDWIPPAVSVFIRTIEFPLDWICKSFVETFGGYYMRTEVTDLKQYMYSYNYKKLGANDCKLNWFEMLNAN